MSTTIPLTLGKPPVTEGVYLFAGKLTKAPELVTVLWYKLPLTGRYLGIAEARGVPVSSWDGYWSAPIFCTLGIESS